MLHLKHDAEEFLDSTGSRASSATYSDHIAHPIMLADRRGDGAASQCGERHLGAAEGRHHRASSTRSSSAISRGDYSDPALTLHYRAEGRNEYTVLLFVPGERPFDLYDPERRGRQKLYVRRVFITDDAELLPAYLRFVRGVIDSEDMPLNISREMLQHNPPVAQIRKAVTNRVLGRAQKMRRERAPRHSSKIWEAFGPVIKEGLYEDMERRDQLLRDRALRKHDAAAMSRSKIMSAGSPPIRRRSTISTAESPAKAKASPQLEGFKARGIEVLLLTDPVDSFWVQHGARLRRQAVQIGDARSGRSRQHSAEGRTGAGMRTARPSAR